MMTTNSDLAAIAVDKSLLKEYQTKDGRTVYLDNNSEFQIKLFNPYTYDIEAEISIDGKSLGERLVIRPGQLIWLERYFDVARKFKFNVYEVDGSDSAVQRAISENGNVEIKFYKEKERKTSNPLVTPYYYDWNNSYGSSASISANDFLDCKLHSSEPGIMMANYCCDISSSVQDSLNCLVNSCVDTYTSSSDASRGISGPRKLFKKTKNIETGRVEKGGYSSQQFTSIDVDMELFPFATERIKLLPKSMKQVYKEDLQKIYCPECGRKVKPKFKFCPFCGNKL